MNDDATLVGFEFPDDNYENSAPDSVDADNWLPKRGPNFASVGDRMRSTFDRVSSTPVEVSQAWESEVERVASRCLPPDAYNIQRAQLVFGRVQAGKTSNFTGLISLLSDNNYDLFIVLAGINLNLRTQTYDRLRKDLGSVPRPGFEVIPSNTQRRASQEAQRIASLLAESESKDEFARKFRRKIVYVVLKEHQNLSWMNETLRIVNQDFFHADALSKSKVLIIDDEVDQASPDTHTNDLNRVGAIHEAISQLRAELKTHTYVGYTATPYANLLMEESSRLRCEIVTALNPGPDYVGPEDLFGGDAMKFATAIDDWSWTSPDTPDSLRKAFAEFIIQASVINGPGDVKQKYLDEPFLSSTDDKITPVSMLIQPHQQVSFATMIFIGLEQLHKGWVRALDSSIGPNGQRDISYANLWNLALKPALLEFELDADQISVEFRDRIETVLRRTQIREINGPGQARGFEFPSDDEFENEPAWVLIGGQLLDRGQTLPHLVQTYMPRPPGGTGASNIRGNIDTIQQRGRFYGQRGQYRRLLRGKFDTDTLDTYREIARIEPINIGAINRLDRAGLGIEKMLLVLELGSGNLRAASSNKIPRSTLNLSSSTWLFRQVFFTDKGQSEKNEVELLATLERLNLDNAAWAPLARRPGFGNARVECPMELAVSLLERWARTRIENPQFQVAVELLETYRAKGHDLVDLHLMARPLRDIRSTGAHAEFRSARRHLVTLKDGALTRAAQITGLTSSNDARFLRQGKIGIQVHFFDMKVENGPADPIVLPDMLGLGVAFPDRARFTIYNGVSA